MKMIGLLWMLVGLGISSCSFGDRGNATRLHQAGTAVAEYELPQRLEAYYGELDLSLRAEELYEALAVLSISKHETTLGYGERHQYLCDADADPQDPQKVVLIYTGERRDRREWASPNNRHQPQTFNTEHVYPQSKLEGSAVSDLHILRVADATVNTQRSNRSFVAGEGGFKLVGPNAFYPGDEWRGDVARMLLYMNLRYREPFEDVGELELFLEWNAADPVSFLEVQRNDVIERAQGVRNPFIDNPHLATAIWGGEAAENLWDPQRDSSEAPGAVEALSLEEVGFENLELRWKAPSETASVAKYEVLLDGDFHSGTKDTSAKISGLKPGTAYELQVVAVGSMGKRSEESPPLKASTLSDTEAPGIPANISATATATSVSLFWTPASDNAGIKGYGIYKEGAFQGFACGNQHTIASLKPETQYSFRIRARDLYGNTSAMSPPLEVRTKTAAPGSRALLIISEYLEGSTGFNKVLEIANLGEEPVDLEAYSLRKITNDEESWGAVLPLSGVLLGRDVLVLAHEKADRPEITEVADILSGHQVLNFNGNDPIGLFLHEELIDMLGRPGGRDFAADLSLRRKKEVAQGNPEYEPSEWEHFPDEETAGLGSH